jgi:CheY-like chemotaxis protein
MLAGVRVLVADDDGQLLDVVCEALTRLDAHVVRASSGGDLIEQLVTAGPFDLIVTKNEIRGAGMPENWTRGPGRCAVEIEEL